jgi:hypothetical protein
MWIGDIRLGIGTANKIDAGTDELVVVEVLRDGKRIVALSLDVPIEDDLERGAFRHYEYFGLPLRNDKTPFDPNAVGIPVGGETTGSTNPSHPASGLEFSSGLNGHLAFRLRIAGDDMWIKDNVTFAHREMKRLPVGTTSQFVWKTSGGWQDGGNWPADAALSTDSREGTATRKLAF